MIYMHVCVQFPPRFATLKDVYCNDSVRLGQGGDGGWEMCLAGPFRPANECLVYSFGYVFIIIMCVHVTITVMFILGAKNSKLIM